eukprot:scaffold29359_cov400-Skeletonema_menzelii.AAC.1
MIQPKTNLIVLQEQSPFSSFFIETGSRLNSESSADKGLKTSSIACIKVRRTRRKKGRCAAEMKSSTNISTYCRGCLVDPCKDGSDSVGQVTAMGVEASSPDEATAGWEGEASTGTDAATSSKGCSAGQYAGSLRRVFATSAIVSVAAQK